MVKLLKIFQKEIKEENPWKKVAGMRDVLIPIFRC